MSEPILFLQKRWKCPHCSRSRTSRKATEQHIARCWFNEDNRTCKTCIFFLSADYSARYGDPQCNCQPGPAACDAGVELPQPEPGSGDLDFVTGCPKWQTRDQEIENVYPLSTSPRS